MPTASESYAPHTLAGENGHALHALLDTARTVADRIAAHAPEVDRPGHFPEQEFRWLHEAGLLTAPLPRAEGGLGLGHEPGTLHALYLLLAEVGRGSLPVGRVYEGHVNALALVHEFGDEAQRAGAAEDARAGRIFGVWNTEVPTSGVRLHPASDGRVRMEGAKTFCSGAGWVDRAFANGVLVGADGAERGWQMILVPMDAPGLVVQGDWWQAEGMRASVSGRVDFSGVTLPAAALIGTPDLYTREPAFSFGAVRFAAVQLGGARALLDAAVQFLRTTGRTDDPIQNARVGEMAVRVESGALWLLGAARLGEGGADLASLVAYSQLTRTAVEGVCLDVLRLADRAVGARGMLSPSVVERVGRDLRLYLRQPNPDGAIVAAGTALLGAEGLMMGSGL